MERVLDHVAIVVPSIADALSQYETLIGARGSAPETVAAQGVRAVFVGRGPGRVELLEPTGPDSPIARFLARRGPGLHHLAYLVPDLEAALADHVANGFEAIDAAPRPGAHGRRVAFLHPRSLSGVLVELIEAAERR